MLFFFSSYKFITDNKIFIFTCGAATPPILAIIEARPRPVERASVGYISGAQMYITLKKMLVNSKYNLKIILYYPKVPEIKNLPRNPSH